MEFLEFAISWCKGEIFEARIILVFGLVLFLCAYLFYKFGFTLYAKEMVLPLFLLGFFYVSVGFGMNYSNQKRIESFTIEYKSSKYEFIKKEKERVEEFKTWYPKVKVAMTIIIAFSILVYFLGGVKVGSFTLVFILMGLSGFVIDHFSEERADIYYEHILKEIRR